MSNEAPTLISLQAYREVFAVYAFADVRGFTRWSSKNQPEMRKLTSILYSAAVAVFGKRKSTKLDKRIVKFLGDGFFAVSEYNDDRPGDLQKRIAEMTENVIRFEDLFRNTIDKSNLHRRRNISLGFGMSFGSAFRFHTSGQSTDYIGNSVNLAARLCGVADASEIVSERDVVDHLGSLSTDTNEWLQFAPDTIDLKSFGSTEVSRANLRSAVRSRMPAIKTMVNLAMDFAKLAGKQMESSGE